MIAIIDYNSGNMASVKNALEKLGFEYCITSDAAKILKADKVIFPGVGRSSQAMKELKRRGLDKVIPQISAPFLGICLGLQLLGVDSEEDDTKCLSIIPGRVRRFSDDVKIPQIGWNKVKIVQDSPIFEEIKNEDYFYFVNSYYLEFSRDIDEFVLGKTCYGAEFVSVVKKDNFYATQFHPEKSGEVGLKLLSNFCRSC